MSRLLSWQGGSASRQGPRPLRAVTFTQWLLSAVRQSTHSRSATQQACSVGWSSISGQGGAAPAAAAPPAAPLPVMLSTAGASLVCFAACSATSPAAWSAASPAASTPASAAATGDQGDAGQREPAKGRSSVEERDEDDGDAGESHACGSSTKRLLLSGCLPMLVGAPDDGFNVCADQTVGTVEAAYAAVPLRDRALSAYRPRAAAAGPPPQLPYCAHKPVATTPRGSTGTPLILQRGADAMTHPPSRLQAPLVEPQTLQALLSSVVQLQVLSARWRTLCCCLFSFPARRGRSSAAARRTRQLLSLQSWENQGSNALCHTSTGR